MSCSAEATTPGADGSPQLLNDARTGNGIPDASSGIRPDAMEQPPQPDAMTTVDCTGADTEPNDSQGQATGQAAITDCDNEGGSAAGSVISGNEDWFTFDASDTSLCSLGPEVTITGNVQACLYLTCTSGTTEVGCPGGTTSATANGAPGCCGTSSFVLDSFNCTGTLSDDTTDHIQVTATSTDTCEQYTVAYNH